MRNSGIHKVRFQAAAEASFDALILLEPVVADGNIVDFTMTYLNGKACTLFNLPAESPADERLCEQFRVFRQERLFDQYPSDRL